MNGATTSSPDWDHLFQIAAAQDGLFTTRQAAAAGYSPPLIAHHLSAGRMVRVRRGVYRLVHFPAGDHEDFTVVWLWSEQEGVFSHQTALALHDLSDVLPAHVHLTLPEAWRQRRLRVPDGVILHYADVAESERRWFGPVPATTPPAHARGLRRGPPAARAAPGRRPRCTRTRAGRASRARHHRGRARALRRSRAMTQAYRTAAAFKQALEQRLRMASASGV